MAAPISMDLRSRIFQARQAGESTAEVAERYDVSPAFVRRPMQRYRENGVLAPKSGPRGRRPLLTEHAQRLRELIVTHPDLTPAEIRDRLGLAVCALTVWRMLRRLGLSFKKSRSTPPSKTAPMCSRPGPTGRNGSRIPRPSA